MPIVCLSVCLSVHLHISTTACPNFTKFSYMLPAVVARSFSGNSAIRNIFSLLWMTSCFHNGANVSESKKRYIQFARWRHWGWMAKLLSAIAGLLLLSVLQYCYGCYCCYHVLYKIQFNTESWKSQDLSKDHAAILIYDRIRKFWNFRIDIKRFMNSLSGEVVNNSRNATHPMWCERALILYYVRRSRYSILCGISLCRWRCLPTATDVSYMSSDVKGRSSAYRWIVVRAIPLRRRHVIMSWSRLHLQLQPSCRAKSWTFCRRWSSSSSVSSSVIHRGHLPTSSYRLRFASLHTRRLRKRTYSYRPIFTSTFPPGGVQSIVIGMYVLMYAYMYVCPFAYFKNHVSKLHEIFLTCYP